jgi:hypothetical protein
MGRMVLDQSDIKFYKSSDEGKAYLRYNDAVGGEPIGLQIPTGYPEGVEEHGGVIKVYEECIEKGITWEKLLGVEIPPDAII